MGLHQCGQPKLSTKCNERKHTVTLAICACLVLWSLDELAERPRMPFSCGLILLRGHDGREGKWWWW